MIVMAGLVPATYVASPIEVVGARHKAGHDSGEAGCFATSSAQVRLGSSINRSQPTGFVAPGRSASGGIMRYAFVALAALVMPAIDTAAAAPDKTPFYARQAVVNWADGYRHRPEPARLPAAVQTLSKSGSLREPETAA